jgi:hypothetical protein
MCLFFRRSWCRFKSRRIGNYVKIVNCTRNCTTVAAKAMHGHMLKLLSVVSGHCTVFHPGKLREGRNSHAVIVRRPASYYLHYKIGLRVIVGAKLYFFCIAYLLIFLHNIF